MKKTIRLILTENVEKLGLVGDQVKVSLGYARNFLLPKKLAVLLNDPKAKTIIAKVKERRAKLEAEINKLKELADELKEKVVVIRAKAGEAGKLFGSVTSELVADKLGVDKKELKMAPIRSLGEHEIEINLGHDIKTKTKIKVEAEKEEKVKRKIVVKRPLDKTQLNKSK